MDLEEALEVAERITYPVVVRPSYVLGGRAMAVVYDAAELADYFREQVPEKPEHPILIDKFLEHAVEVDVDALSDGPGSLCGRDHGTYRGSGHPFRRLGLRAAFLLALLRPCGAHRGPGRSPGPRTQGRGSDEHSIRHQGRRHLYSGSQSARLAHRAFCLQGHGRAPAVSGNPGHAGQEPGRTGPLEHAQGRVSPA